MMKKLLRFILKLFLYTILLCVVVLISSVALLHSQSFVTDTVAPFAIKELKLPLTIGSINLDGLSFLELKNVKYEEPKGIDVKAKKASLEFNLLALLTKEVSIDSLSLDAPQIDLSNVEQKADESQTKDKAKKDDSSSESGFSVSVESINIDRGSFKEKSINLSGLNLNASLFLDNHYSLSSSKGKIAIKEFRNNSITSPVSLKSNFNVTAKNKIFSIKDFLIEAKEGENTFAQAKASGTVAQDLSSSKSNITLDSEVLDIYKIMLFSDPASSKTTDKATDKATDKTIEEPAFETTAKSSKETLTIQLPEILSTLWLGANVNLNLMSFKDLKVSNISTKLNSNKGALNGEIALTEVINPQLKESVDLKSNFDLSISKEAIAVKKLFLQTDTSKEAFFDIEINGNIFKNVGDKESNLDIVSKKLDVDKVLKVLGIKTKLPESKIPLTEEEIKAAKEKVEKEKKEKEKNADVEPKIELPLLVKELLLKANIDFQNIQYAGTKLQKVNTIFVANKANFALKELLIHKDTTDIAAGATLNLSNELPSYTLTASTLLVKVADLIPSKTGDIKDVTLMASGIGLSRNALKKNLQLYFTASLKDIDFDKSLERVIPFNLIFIPFTTLQNINKLNPLGSFPEVITGPLNKISGAVGDLQKLKCDKGTIKVMKTGNDILIQEATFDMKGAIPDLKIPGKISLDGKLEINSKLGLHSFWVPMPIKGTIGFPYPDIPVFIKELALGVLKSPMSFADDITGGVSKGIDMLGGKKEEENKE